MKKVEPRTLPGFMELLPQDQILFNDMKNTIESVYKKYGFIPLDTPVIESSEVLLAKAGGETEKQIYRFKKGDNDLSLRFDLTVPLAKYVASNYNELVFPFKRYQIGKVYRGERPQKGRFREFYQCDIDIIGNEELSLINDALIPSIIYDVFKCLNIGPFVIRINNRKILNGLFEYLNIDNNTEVLRIIDKMEKMSIEDIKLCLKDLSLKDETINYILGFVNISCSNSEKLNKLKELNINNEMFTEGLNELETVINYLRELNIDEKYYNIDLKISRGLDYYTGTVYETILTDYPSIGSICSGGRYDNLAEYYTDKKLPGVGISIGLTRLFYQLKESGIIESNKSTIADILVIPMSENLAYSFKVASLLRNNNINTDICTINKGFKQKMNYANRIKIDNVIIIGDDEEKNNYVSVKNMLTGEQVKVDFDKIVNYIKDTKVS